MHGKIYLPKTIDQPQPVKLEFDGKEKNCFFIDIAEEEYDLCEFYSQGSNFWGNSKPGAYGAGLGRTNDDKFKPARTGLLGQMAYGKLFGESVDLVYRFGGDDQDSLLGGKYKVDVKCPMKNYGKALIYHTNEWGRRIPVDKDIYVFGFIQSEDRVNKIATVVINGFSLKKDVENSDVKPGIKGNGHLNYEIYFSNLRPIEKLLKLKKEYFDINL
jgi:hypothetical protein